MVIDPAHIKRGEEDRPTVTGDRPCPTCDYNLRGLRINDPCPECGEQIRPVSGRGSVHDNLVLAPIGYLRNLRFAFVLLACSLPVMVGGVHLYRIGIGQPTANALAVVGASIAWWFGVVLATEPRRSAAGTLRSRQREHQHLRWTNRGLQGFWLLGGVLLLVRIHAAGGTAQAWLDIGRGLATLVALFGLAPLAWQLSDIADWGQDEGLAERLRASAWGVAGAGALAVVMPFIAAVAGPVAFFFALIGVLAMVAWPLAVVLFEVCLIQFVPMVAWAIRNWAAARERDARRAERKRAREAEFAAPPPEAAPAPEPQPAEAASRAAGGGRPAPAQVPGPAAPTAPAVESSRELNPYELEPDG